MRRIASLAVVTLFPVLAFSATGCLSDDDDSNGATADGGGGTTVTTPDGGDTVNNSDATVQGADPSTAANTDALPKYVPYRDDLTKHPGCSIAGLNAVEVPYTPAVLDGYTCAAKEYGTDDGVKPITIYVHGNSSTPSDWEKCPATPGSNETAMCTDTTTPMISDRLTADGFHGYASDVRYDLVPSDGTDTANVNPSKNYDHGWAVPIVESLFKAVVTKYPTRKINMIGFSVGTTVIRDALRRLHRAGFKPFEHIGQLYLASGANHGVKTFEATGYCTGGWDQPVKFGMEQLAACQLGDLTDYMPSPFLSPLNGPIVSNAGSWETPCSDGNMAYGQANECGGNKVTYTTVVFADSPDGTTKDEFVDQASAMLNGATNTTVSETDNTGYFYGMNFYHHFASIRSVPGVNQAVAVLEK